MTYVQHEPNSGCWLWTGCVNKCGYGCFRVEGKTVLSHLWLYEQTNPPVPDGLELDHLCRVRCCVNPEHLEAVTHAENMKRGRWVAKTHCPQGHEYTDENTYVSNGKLRKYRGCIICRRASVRRVYARKKLALAATIMLVFISGCVSTSPDECSWSKKISTSSNDELTLITKYEIVSHNMKVEQFCR